MVDLPNALVIGAGAGSSHFVGVNCELMPNMVVSEDGINRTHATKMVPNSEEYNTFEYQCKDCGPLANVFLSKGEKGQVCLSFTLRYSMCSLMTGYDQVQPYHMLGPAHNYSGPC
jgi:hypothetical protein